MALDEKQILQVLDLFQKSDWQHLQLQSGTVRLNISKTERPGTVTRTAPPPASVSTPPPAQSTAAVAPAATPAAPVVDPRWVAVRAPMLGHFYAAPKPGAPPFVQRGQRVDADDTVGILEVMKLMNHVKAGCRGTVVQLVAVNGELVEFDQALFYIDPA